MVARIGWLAIVFPLLCKAFNIEGLENLAAPCEPFKCSKGHHVTAKPEHVVTVNGCGTSMIHVQSNVDFTECCNWHDACYATCGMSKKACERRFDKCMKKQCEEEPNRTECEGHANMYVLTVKMMGCAAFKESQKEACTCSTTAAQVEQADRERLLWLFQAHDPSQLSTIDALLEKYPIEKRPVMFLRLLKKYPKALVVDENKQDTMPHDDLFATGLATDDKSEEEDDIVEHIEL